MKVQHSGSSLLLAGIEISIIQKIPIIFAELRKIGVYLDA
jgi:hypothetical protein